MQKKKREKNHMYCVLFFSLQFFFLSYPPASAEDLSQNSDNCAICWEKMESARKLPCSHLFHKYVMHFSLTFLVFFYVFCVSLFITVLVYNLGWNKMLVVPHVVVVSVYIVTVVNMCMRMR